MSQPYIGEIRMFGGSFAPAGWAFCDGQLMAISENDTLFNLIGTTYGGDGQETFGIPDLRGRVPIHMGTGPKGTTYTEGEMGGVESVTLSVNQIPAHNHALIASANLAAGTAPASQVAGKSSGATVSPYGADQPVSSLSPQAVGPAGGSQPHENLQPYACINFIISLFGVYPSQT
jgi:microcystin-dependent protein